MNPGDPLPYGWRWTTLGEACKIVNGSTPKSGTPEYWGGEICWITPADLGVLDSPTIRSSARSITQAGYESCSTALVPVGSVVLSSRAPIGHLGIAATPLCTNQGCKSFVPSDEVDSTFLYYTLLESVDELRSLGSGATFAEVSKRKLSAFPIPLPPLAKQRRIVAALEAQLAAAERARRAALSQLNALEAMPAALLRKVFEREAKIRFWPRVEISKVCIQDRSMISIEHPDYAELPYLGLEHVEGGTGRILVTKEQAMTSTSISNNFLFTPEHVLYGKLRPYLNKVALPEFAGRCTTEIIPLRPTHVDRRWLAWFLRRDDTVAYAMRDKTGSRMPRASMRELLRLPIPLPPIEEQRRIVAELERELAATERARAAAREGLALAEALPGAILRRAFTPGASA